jgi:segregation and condensation protein B
MTDMSDNQLVPGSDPLPDGSDLDLDFGLGDVVEALLFVSDGPLSPARIAAVLDEDEDSIRAALTELRRKYQRGGLRILLHDDLYQMATAPDATLYCRALLGLEPNQRLTQASLETLAVVAYRQPVTRALIEDVRGVNSDSPLSRLVAYGLVTAIGKSERPGRPMLYGTTPGFLAYFGVDSLDDLPQLDLPEFAPGHEAVATPNPMDTPPPEAVEVNRTD